MDSGSKANVTGPTLYVRPGLELVVPSVTAVKAFLGEADFHRVQDLAAGCNSGIDPPLVTRLLQIAPCVAPGLSPFVELWLSNWWKLG